MAAVFVLHFAGPCDTHASNDIDKGGIMRRRDFLPALAASAAFAQTPAPVTPHKGRLKQCVTRGVFGRGTSLEDCCREAARPCRPSTQSYERAHTGQHARHRNIRAAERRYG